MARTYAAVVLEDDDEEQRWKLVRLRSSSVELVRKLRTKGFYANYPTLDGLEEECKRLSTLPDADDHANGRPSDARERTYEQAAQYLSRTESVDADMVNKKPKVDGSKTLKRALSWHTDVPKESIVYKWHVTADNGESVPITEVPYADQRPSSGALHTEFFLNCVLGLEKKQMRIPIQEWKIDLTADASLAMFAKSTNQVWVELGKPEELYEQTIRSIQVYIHLFSMVVTDLEVTRSMLFQHLTSKFIYWKVKPSVSDLDESIALTKKFNLNCLFPLERRVQARVMTEVANLKDPDSEDQVKALNLQQAMSRQNTTVELELEEASGENTVKTRSDSNDETLTVRHPKRIRTGTEAGTNADLDRSEFSSQTIPDRDHVLLSSKLRDLKNRKATSQMSKDTFVIDKIQNRETDSTGMYVYEVKPGDFETCHNSSISFDDDESIQASDNAVKDERTVTMACTESRVNEILKKTQRIHKGGLEHEYKTEPFPTIRTLWNSSSMILSAFDCMEKGGSMEDVQSLCSIESLRNFHLNEVALREFGVSQFMPAVHRQKEVAERINYYAHDGDTIVEICSQSVDYVSLLKERLQNMGKLCNYKRFVVDKSQRQDLKDCINKEALPTGSKLLICLSLSFALRGEQRNKILDTALDLKPKLIVLIAPLFSRRLDEHSAYNLIWSDDEILQSEISWPWGDLEVPINVLDKKKGVSPTISLWSRTDWATKHRQIASRFGHLKKSVLSSLRAQIATS